MLELVYVVIGKVLLERASDVIRLFAALPLAPTASDFDVLVALTGYEHRV